MPGAMEPGHDRRAAVDRDDRRHMAGLPALGDPRLDRVVIGAVQQVDAALQLVLRQAAIRRYLDAVARRRAEIMRVRPAVAVDHQPRVIGVDQSRVESPRQMMRRVGSADVPGDMHVESGLRHAEVAERRRYPVARMIADQQERRRRVRRDDLEGRRLAGSDQAHQNRSMRKGLMSIAGVRPATRSAISAPVVAPSVSPR